MKNFTLNRTIVFRYFYLFLVGLFLAFSQANAQSVIYVDVSASGNNDGSSWTDAYVGLQDALSSAGAEDTIWVAQGTYKPTTNTDRTIYFEIPDEVAVYGGFDGTEGQLNQRDIENNQTVLSGDIGTVDDSTDNSYHVVYFRNVSSSTRLDGFIVTGGHTGFFMPPEEEPDPSLFSDTLAGGGIVNVAEGESERSDPTIENCLITENFGMLGGGLCNYTDAGTTGPSIKNCEFIDNNGTIGGGLSDFVFNDGLCEATVDSSLFSGNKAEMGYGGGMSSMGMGGESSPVLKHCSFENNSANEGGGFAVSANNSSAHNGSAKPELHYCYFAENLASGDGGGLISDVSADCQIELTMDSCEFEHNKAYEEGGGMDFDADSAGYASLHMTNCTFYRDSAVADGWAGGGGLNVSGGTDGEINAHLDSCLFEETYASDDGGGIRYSIDSAGVGSLNVSNCEFISNKADSSSGAGIYSSSYLTGVNNMTLNNCLFKDNEAGNQGGGVFNSCYNSEISPEINECTFNNNTALKQGGGMYNVSWGKGSGEDGENLPVLTNCTFEGNTSVEKGGGAVYNIYSNAEFLHCKFSNNTTEEGGGAIANNNSHIVMDSCEVEYNESNNHFGGGINNWKSNPQITNSTIANNVCDLDGAGINNFSSSPVLINCNIHDNSAGQNGGAIANSANEENVQPVIKNCYIANNVAEMNGGGIYNRADGSSCDLELSNSVIYGNVSGSGSNGDGGGICNISLNDGTCSPEVNNCTFSGNTAVNSGGALFNQGSGGTVEPVITNSIVWGNTVTGGQINNQSATPSYSYSNIEGSGGSGSWKSSFGTDEGNNIDSDPSFKSAADTADAPNVTCNLDLNASSTGIDTGTPDTTGLNLPESDIRGNPRILLEQIDMGAYEADTLAPSLTTQDTTIQLDSEGYVLLTPDKVVQSASDDGVIVDTLLSREEFDCSDLGTVTIEVTIVDNVENQITKTAEVTVADTVKPVLDPDTVTIYLDEDGNASVTKEELVHEATDNCSLKDTTIGQSTFTCADLGDNEVEVTITDQSDNESTQMAIVTVEDSIKPAITCPGDQSVDAGSDNTYTVSGTEFDPSETSDNCSEFTLTNDFNDSETLDGASFSSGTTTVVWTVADAAGNTAECSFDVTVSEYVGINELSEQGISIYPNPTSGRLVLEFDQFKQINQITILDITGKQILERTNLQAKEVIDLSDFRSGMYFITIRTDKKVITTRVIKN